MRLRKSELETRTLRLEAIVLALVALLHRRKIVKRDELQMEILAQAENSDNHDE